MSRWIIGFVGFMVMVGLAMVVWGSLARRGFDPIGDITRAISPTTAATTVPVEV